jgi:phage terminase large subunit-like protein
MRAISFIETVITVPSGRGAGDLLRLAPYQRNLLEILLAEDAAAGAFQIPAGNAKSTLAAAVGLWALCDPPDAPQVALLASSGTQAARTIYTPARVMVTNSPVLSEFVKIRRDNTLRGFETAHNNGSCWILPALDERLQGLNPTLALVDEAEYVDVSILQALEDRLGKRDEQLIWTFGTPGPTTECLLHHVRTMAAAGAPYGWVEHAAELDADIRKPATWRAANPALAAGILGEHIFERAIATIEAATDPTTRLVLETRFRRFRLGCWIAGAVADSWLPAGAWAACPTMAPPDAGESIVLAIDGTYKRSTAIVGADLETGAIFLVWAGEAADDDEVEAVLAEACRRWVVTELVHYPTIRPQLIAQLERKSYPLSEWKLGRELETKATGSLWQAIAEGQLVHDGSAILAEHFANVGYRDTPSGVILRRVHREGAWIDAAMAARMAWWSALPTNRTTPTVW